MSRRLHCEELTTRLFPSQQYFPFSPPKKIADQTQENRPSSRLGAFRKPCPYELRIYPRLHLKTVEIVCWYTCHRPRKLIHLFDWALVRLDVASFGSTALAS